MGKQSPHLQVIKSHPSLVFGHNIRRCRENTFLESRVIHLREMNPCKAVPDLEGVVAGLLGGAFGAMLMEFGGEESAILLGWGEL